LRKIYIIAGIAVAVLIAAAAVWYYVSPGMTVKAMVDAARANDEARFSTYVDYPALRADMKSELTNRLQEEAKRDGTAEAKLGLAMGMAMMNPMVDAMVSPKGMTVAFATLAKQQEKSKETGKVAKGALPADPEIRRQGLNTFVVSGKDTPESGLVFQRHGLGWKLSGVELPPLPAKARAR
jgi:hypothetical protein